MKLYFLRHGLAEDASAKTGDAQRALTPRGVQRMKKAAQVMNALGVRPTRLYSSPLVRARQTADIVGEELKLEVTVRGEVGPGFGVRAVDALLEDLTPGDDVMFVGHEPDLSSVVSALVGGGGDITMKKGGLARVDIYEQHPARGTLVWLLAPRIFDRLEE